MKSQMTIGKKLFLSFGSALLLTLIVGGVAFWAIGSLGASIAEVANMTARKQVLAASIDTNLSDVIAAERGLVARAYMKDRATVEQYNQDFHKAQTEWKKNMDEFTPLIRTAEARKIMSDIFGGWENVNREYDNFYGLITAGKVDEAVTIVKEKLVPILSRTNEQVAQLTTLQGDLMTAAAKTAEGQVTISRWVTIAMILLSIVVGVIIVWVVRQINAALRQTVTELSEGAEQVSSAASQVSSSSQSLAQGSSEQAASLEETSASSEEINSMARKNKRTRARRPT
jgi:methyl-accepting chemotaxis protein/methyl-accepting chemotaxis protein-1 (serine sensor receptor)